MLGGRIFFNKKTARTLQAVFLFQKVSSLFTFRKTHQFRYHLKTSTRPCHTIPKKRAWDATREHGLVGRGRHEDEVEDEDASPVVVGVGLDELDVRPREVHDLHLLARVDAVGLHGAALPSLEDVRPVGIGGILLAVHEELAACLDVLGLDDDGVAVDHDVVEKVVVISERTRHLGHGRRGQADRLVQPCHRDAVAAVAVHVGRARQQMLTGVVVDADLVGASLQLHAAGAGGTVAVVDAIGGVGVDAGVGVAAGDEGDGDGGGEHVTHRESSW
ncbi:MAG: hypothetical protein COU32_03350 [Candidatus Magasanikbacteria bacterium CG10_big_fil_rev_8_21_14_0_10_42_10]|uniref:Uncharacterized protein n=1 Tax=Candidatus Magasanikbacteria bacterium CG10_big_fil_rev_8_21_14_0_10_42_10 TaxID=1974649 RepID=A0A2H0TVM1_9BACT|nr:MAG: hypothetical protein COU32_03350 [Candidatus Magasanikbacteria bacterium CG10_big_fil_rev_8_21_14_0_10_42_10]